MTKGGFLTKTIIYRHMRFNCIDNAQEPEKIQPFMPGHFPHYEKIQPKIGVSLVLTLAW